MDEDERISKILVKTVEDKFTRFMDGMDPIQMLPYLKTYINNTTEEEVERTVTTAARSDRCGNKMLWKQLIKGHRWWEPFINALNECGYTPLSTILQSKLDEISLNTQTSCKHQQFEQQAQSGGHHKTKQRGPSAGVYPSVPPPDYQSIEYPDLYQQNNLNDMPRNAHSSYLPGSSQKTQFKGDDQSTHQYSEDMPVLPQQMPVQQQFSANQHHPAMYSESHLESLSMSPAIVDQFQEMKKFTTHTAVLSDAGSVDKERNIENSQKALLKKIIPATDNLKGLGTDNLKGLGTDNLKGLGTDNLKGLGTDNLKGLGTDNLKGLGTDNLKGLGTDNLKGLGTDNLKGLGTDNLKGLGTDNLKGLGTDNLKGLGTDNLKGLGTDNLKGLGTDNLKGLGTDNLKGLGTDNLKGLGTDNLKGPSDEVRDVTGKELEEFTTEVRATSTTNTPDEEMGDMNATNKTDLTTSNESLQIQASGNQPRISLLLSSMSQNISSEQTANQIQNTDVPAQPLPSTLGHPQPECQSDELSIFKTNPQPQCQSDELSIFKTNTERSLELKGIAFCNKLLNPYDQISHEVTESDTQDEDHHYTYHNSNSYTPGFAVGEQIDEASCPQAINKGNHDRPSEEEDAKQMDEASCPQATNKGNHDRPSEEEHTEQMDEASCPQATNKGNHDRPSEEEDAKQMDEASCPQATNKGNDDHRSEEVDAKQMDEASCPQATNKGNHDRPSEEEHTEQMDEASCPQATNKVNDDRPSEEEDAKQMDEAACPQATNKGNHDHRSEEEHTEQMDEASCPQATNKVNDDHRSEEEHTEPTKLQLLLSNTITKTVTKEFLLFFQ